MGRKLTKGWVEYGAIDHTIIDKLQNEEESRVRLQGAEELNRCIRNMGDMQPLTSQIRSAAKCYQIKLLSFKAFLQLPRLIAGRAEFQDEPVDS